MSAARPTRRVYYGPLAQALAEQEPTDAVWCGPYLGSFGLYPNEYLPGGAILHTDTEGFCAAWYSASTSQLERAWAKVLATRHALQGPRGRKAAGEIS